MRGHRALPADASGACSSKMADVRRDRRRCRHNAVVAELARRAQVRHNARGLPSAEESPENRVNVQVERRVTAMAPRCCMRRATRRRQRVRPRRTAGSHAPRQSVLYMPSGTRRGSRRRQPAALAVLAGVAAASRRTAVGCPRRPTPPATPAYAARRGCQARPAWPAGGRRVRVSQRTDPPPALGLNSRTARGCRPSAAAPSR